jgi:hypothetical protein
VKLIGNGHRRVDTICAAFFIRDNLEILMIKRTANGCECAIVGNDHVWIKNEAEALLVSEGQSKDILRIVKFQRVESD